MEDHDDGDGRFEYYQIKDMHFKFPQLFYPGVYCTQTNIYMERERKRDEW